MADYAELSDIKSYLRIPADDTADDTELALVLTAASRAIDRATNRTFTAAGESATARYYTGFWENGRYIVPIGDLMTTTDLAVAADDGTGGWATSYTLNTDYSMWPLNAAADGKPWARLSFGTGVTVPTVADRVRVTARWGWTAIPSSIKLATLIQAARFFKRRDAPFGVAGSPEMGNELRLLAKVDPDVEVMVADYRRWWAAA